MRLSPNNTCSMHTTRSRESEASVITGRGVAWPMAESGETWEVDSKLEGPCGQRSRGVFREVSQVGWHDPISIKTNNSWASSKQNKVQSSLGLHSGCLPKKIINTLHINILQKKKNVLFICMTNRFLSAPHEHAAGLGTQDVSCTGLPHSASLAHAHN